jgi:outer membrane protein OmpA-like peptidoglycan-associated protein
VTYGTKSRESSVDEFPWRPGFQRVDAERPVKEAFMFPVNRCKLVAALIALFLSVGCTSTSPTLDSGTHEELEPVAETSDSNAVALHQEPVALKPVYFDTNEAMLRADARDLLKSYAQSILDHPEWGVVTIEGHCDERGSDEYNRALGRRRAAVVEHYLETMGVPAERVATRTFGEERPAVPGHSESAWSYNRRSELQVDALTSASL